MAFLPILGFERYWISQIGNVLDTVTEEFIQTQKDLLFTSKVKLLYPNRTDRYRQVLVARLILITHKPIEGVDLNSLWSPKISSSEARVCDRSLDYDFGDYIPPVPESREQFFLIPGFYDTEINLNGVVRMSGKEVKIGDQRGYAVASARTESGKSVTVGRHRLMAMTFLRRPVFCGDLIVNHKDGKPAHDELDNLEWVTYLGNMTHAHETSLVTTSIPIEVLDKETGQTREFFSLGAFCRTYDLSQRETKRLEFRMRTFEAVDDYRGFAIRKKDQQVPWEELSSLDKYQGNAKEIVAKNRHNGELTEFLQAKDAAVFLEVSQYRLREKLRKFGTVNIGDFEVSYGIPSILAGNTNLEDG